MPQLVSNLIGQFLEVAIPPACIACYRALGPRTTRRDAHSLLCEECGALLEPLDQARACLRCGASPARRASEGSGIECCSECEKIPGTFAEARSSFPYDSPAGQIVRNMKYQCAPYLADYLIELTPPEVAEWLTLAAADALVTPVPMGVVRELRKGYNQAEELAHAVSKCFGGSMLKEGSLLRTKAGSPQARFHSRAERAQNVADAYFIKRADAVKGAKILVVDDVMTTGATVSAVAAALLAAGAASVFVFTPVRARLGEDKDEASQLAVVN